MVAVDRLFTILIQIVNCIYSFNGLSVPALQGICKNCNMVLKTA